jgi:hypothetical protein
MRITFTGQETSFTKTAKGGYSTMVVGYVDDKGANKSWKLISFANPKVFDIFKEAKPNSVYEVTTAKDAKDYTQWADAVLVGGATGPTAVKPASVSNYETREERAARQVLIVRQSCLAQAVAYYGLQKEAPNHVDLLSLADTFVDWVFKYNEDEMEDVPY